MPKKFSLLLISFFNGELNIIVESIKNIYCFVCGSYTGAINITFEN